MGSTAQAGIPVGLTSREAAERLAHLGPNALPEARPRPLLALASKLWGPVPWMLECTLLLQLALGKIDEAVIIGLLLVLNAGIGAVQEGRATAALALLRKRLAVEARTLRDGHWQRVDAQSLVPGDVVRLRIGDLVPADARIAEGELLLDQSALTGEALPVEIDPGATAYAGAVVKRGEATALITATGTHTYFGRTAELVREARAPSHLQEAIVTVVRYLVAFDIALVLLLGAYALMTHMLLIELAPFALMLLVASVPVALPATFTLATLLGAVQLSDRGVLATRLSAIEEAAAMDVMCCDKTGTMTENRLSVASLHAFAPYSEQDLLLFAALACEDATQDPIDLAILEAARARRLPLRTLKRVQFVPFDPGSKRSEARYVDGERELWVSKGAPSVIATLVGGSTTLGPEAERLATQGYRVLAVATGGAGGPRVAGLVALLDPPRPDSAPLVQRLRALGVRVLLVTGDSVGTARTVAAQLGMTGPALDAARLKDISELELERCDVFAGVYPEDKFRLIRSLQLARHVAGMTGDGVNDAPALKQADVGVAVCAATDVAKAAAGLVLTTSGLQGVIAAVESSRRVYQRMLTYTLNKIIKTVQLAVFLTLGVMLTGEFVVTPLLVLLLLFANDFVTMSIATDRVSLASTPQRWHVGTLIGLGGVLSIPILALCFAVLYAVRDVLHLPLAQQQTVVFVLLVAIGQGTVYLVRERAHFWASRPSAFMLAASAGDFLIVGVMATRGILMAPVSATILGAVVGAVLVCLALIDRFKIRLLRSFGLP